jgi:hypothetical protein
MQRYHNCDTHAMQPEKTSVEEHIQMQTNKNLTMEHRMQLRFIQVAANMQLKK